LKELNWLQPVVDAWEASVAQGRPPHALMLTGAVGTGKRAAASWLARRRLGLVIDPLPVVPLTVPEHADLRWISPPDDKHTIGIDQVRELVHELSLTSYEGGGKVAVIEPADAMTTSAANSLLKTLEEPPGDTLLILVVDRPGRLPATIVSRCQRLAVRVPGEAAGLAWLQAQQPGVTWGPVLRDAGFAPLAALQAYERLEETNAMAEDFVGVADGRAAPLAVAARWAKFEPEFVLGWLARQVQICISRTSIGAAAGVSAVVSDSVLERIDRQKLFCYLDIINRLRGQPAGSFNVQLTLECLLIDWSERLEQVEAQA
jgi:DNA polymerase-3 subunit delta'